MKSLCPNLVSQNDAFPNKECCNQLSPKAKKSPTIFSLTLLSSSYLYHFLSPVPLFQSDPSSIVPSFSSVLAAAIEGLQGSGGLKVSLEQSPPNAEHCTRLSSSDQSSATTPCHIGELLLQDKYPLGMSCWEVEAPEIFLNLLSQLQQQKHLTFLSKSIQGSFYFPFFFF